MKVVSVNLDISTDCDVSGGDEVVVLVHVLVLSSFQEFTLHDAGVLLSWLEDLNGIVTQEETDDESSVDILWNAGVESGGEAEYFLIVVNVLEEVSLWLVWK